MKCRHVVTESDAAAAEAAGTAGGLWSRVELLFAFVGAPCPYFALDWSGYCTPHTILRDLKPTTPADRVHFNINVSLGVAEIAYGYHFIPDKTTSLPVWWLVRNN